MPFLSSIQIVILSLSKYGYLNYSGAACVYHDDVIYNRSGSGAFEFGYAGQHQFKKDFYITGTHAFGTTNNYFKFNGTGNQTISRGHSLNSTFIRLEVDKPSGDLLIDLPLTIASNLNLQKGLIKTTTGNNFVGSLGTSITGGSDSSYVEGPMLRYGTSTFTYPVGGGGVYAPVTLDAVASNCTFKVEYIPEDPDSLYSRSAKDTTIGFVNRCGYWNIDRTFGSQNTTPTLGWDNNPCYSTAPVNASVALWDGSTWKDKGNAAYTGTSAAGNVKSAATISSYPTIVNLGGVCNLQASLTANRDTLIEGYLETFTASPANQSNYKFYVNGVLKQDSSISIFKTSSLANEDSLKVIVRNIDNCPGEALIIVNVGQTDNLDEDTAWLFDYNLFANDSIIIETSDSIYCSEKLITTDLNGNSSVVNAEVVQTPSIVEQYHNYGLTLRDNLTNLVGQPIGINDSNVVLTPGIYYLESADILENKFILNGSSNSLFIFNIDDDAVLDSLVLFESSFIENNNNVVFNVNGDAIISNINLNHYSLLAHNIVIKANYNLHGSLWAKQTIRIDDPIVFYGQGFPSEPVNCNYSDYPCNLVKNSEFSCPLPTIAIWGSGWGGNGSLGLLQITNQIFWQTEYTLNGSYLQRETIGGNTQYYLGLNPNATGSVIQQLSGYNIQQGELFYIKFRYKNAGNSCNAPAGYCPLDRLFVSVSEGISYSPFSTYVVASDASFTSDPTYSSLPVQGVPGLPQREYFTDSQLGNITNTDWIDYVSGPHTANFDINSISFYARTSQGGSNTGNGGNVFIDDVKLESCCLGDLATLVSSKTSDFINDAETTLPTVKQELASIITISSVDPSGFDGSLENIKVTINGNNSGTISIVGNLMIDVGELEIINSELLFSKCSSILFLNQSINLKKLIINSSFLHSCDSKLWSGILINGSNSEALYIINNSRIEDAIAAVQASNNPLLIIDNNKFIKLGGLLI